MSCDSLEVQNVIPSDTAYPLNHGKLLLAIKTMAFSLSDDAVPDMAKYESLESGGP